jgi:hypothetical protein
VLDDFPVDRCQAGDYSGRRPATKIDFYARE